MIVLEFVVVIVGIRAEFQLLYLNNVLLLLRVVLFLFILVLPLAIIHGLGDRRLGCWRDKDQVQTKFLRSANGRGRRHNLDGSIREDSPDFSGTDCFVYVFPDTGTARREISGWKHQLRTEGIPTISRF